MKKIDLKVLLKVRELSHKHRDSILRRCNIITIITQKRNYYLQ